MGNYIKNNLINGETVEFETSYHWIIFFSLRALLTLFIAPYIARYTDEFAITNKRVIIIPKGKDWLFWTFPLSLE